MNNFTPFENQIRETYHLSEMDPAFSTRLERDLKVRKAELSQPTRKANQFHWAYVLTPLALLVVMVFAIGPNMVWAQVLQWLGYVPGVGLVDSNTQIMLLEAPQQMEREGVLLKIDNGIFSPDKSIVQYSFFNVPDPVFYPDMQLVQCSESAYLETADGNRYVEIQRGEFEGLPAGTESATLVFPCISNVLLGSAPENWRVSLRLVPAPAEAMTALVLDVLPVEQEAQPTELATEPETQVPQTQPDTLLASAEPVPDGIQVKAVIPVEDSLILVGSYAIPPEISEASWLFEGAIELKDSLGNPIRTRVPEDYQSLVNSLGGDPSQNWALQFKPAPHQSPLQLEQSLVMTQPLPESSLEYEIDLPEDLDSWVQITLDQDLQIDGHTIHLLYLGLSHDPDNTAWLILDKGPEVFDIRLQVLDPNSQTRIDSIQTKELDDKVIIDFTIPETAGRKLLLNFYEPTVVSKSYSLLGTWAPDAQVISALSTPEAVSQVCLSYDQYQAPAPDIAAIPAGKILVVRNTDRGEELILSNLDGSDPQVLDTQGGWDGALSLDGSKLFYLGDLDRTMHILDLRTGEEELLPFTEHVSGIQPIWSPDGSMIAFYGLGYAPNVLRLEDWSVDSVQISAQARIDGWSPENELYVTELAYVGNPGRTLAYDFTTRTSHEVNLPNMLVHSTNAYPLSAENGKFIYTNSDGTAAYIYDPATQETTTLVEGLKVYNLGWAGRDWAVVSIQEDSGKSAATMLVNPLTCQTIRLPYVEDGRNFGMVMDAVMP
jgi:WD40 repeat protein